MVSQDTHSVDSDMKNPFKRFHELRTAEEFDEALVELARVEKHHKLPPNILVLKGICILLAKKSGYGLDDAETAFKAALAVDKEYVDALLELGYLYLYVHNDAQESIPYFRKAIELARSQMSNAVQGLAEALAETISPEEGLKFIENATKNPFDQRNIDESMEWIKVLNSQSLNDVLDLLGKEMKQAEQLQRKVR